MRFIRQKSMRNCGQIAVAMLVDRPLEDIAEVISHNHGTRTKELVRALRHFGYTCPDRMKRKPVDFGLAQLHSPDRSGWHWIAIGEGKVWDGNSLGPISLDEYKKWDLRPDQRITSFLPVTKS
jgi:hypothetical protein